MENVKACESNRASTKTSMQKRHRKRLISPAGISISDAASRLRRSQTKADGVIKRWRQLKAAAKRDAWRRH